ncbi:type VI secretion system contractile sheath small subunit [Paracoccus sp. (in: a-proteobacteria)]|uniref:type VI secretion system contractile sheath small subunit n=1 Tax=Paracoccus sp. TaxID=267 RepID=UPI0032209B47
MSESKAKVIERNRAPRVQIAYDVEHYGSPTTIELPFVMGVMADLAGKSASREATKTPAERAFVEVDAGRFPAFMEALSPRVTARVPNRLPGKEGGEPADEEMFVDLSFHNMGDFAPDRIATQIPELAELLKMRRKLEELLSYMDGKASAEKRIAQLLNDEPLLARVAEQAVTEGAGAPDGDKAEG